MSQAASVKRKMPSAPAIAIGLAVTSVLLGIVIGAKGKPEPEPEKALPPVQVITQVIKTTELVDTLRLHGSVAPWEKLRVSARVPATAKKILVDEGMRVQKGDILITLDDSDYLASVASVEASVAGARAQFDLATTQLERVKVLHRDGAINDSAFDSARAGHASAKAGLLQAEASMISAKLALSRTVIRAPISGIITAVPVTTGQLLNPGDLVAMIVDVSRVRVTVGIPEKDVLSVRSLEDAPITFKAIEGKNFTGTRIYLGAEPSMRSNAYPMEFAIDNHAGLIRPGMIASVAIIRGINKKAILVPAYSIIPRENDLVLFVVENDVAVRRVVERGVLKGQKIADMEIEITSGLKEGDAIIIKGQRNVDDGQAVAPQTRAEAMKKLQELLSTSDTKDVVAPKAN